MFGLSPVAVCGLLVAVVSPVAEHRLWGMQASAVAAVRLWSAVAVVHGFSCPAVCGTFLDQGSKLCPLCGQADS